MKIDEYSDKLSINTSRSSEKITLNERGQGTGTEVNPQSWTQLKGSHGTQFRREISSD